MTTECGFAAARVGAVLCILFLQSCAASPRFVDRDISFRSLHDKTNVTKKTINVFPKIDIIKTCSDAANFNADEHTRTNCLRSETKAKDEFALLWAAMTSEDVNACVEPAWPGASYVEMLTCVEVNNKSLAVAASGGGAVAPKQGDTRHPAVAAKVD